MNHGVKQLLIEMLLPLSICFKLWVGQESRRGGVRIKAPLHRTLKLYLFEVFQQTIVVLQMEVSYHFIWMAENIK